MLSLSLHRQSIFTNCYGHYFYMLRVLLNLPDRPNTSAMILSVQFSCSVVSDSLRPHESQHARPPCPSPTAGVYPNSCPSSWWCHPAISSSVVPFSSCPQSLPASESFPMSQLFCVLLLSKLFQLPALGAVIYQFLCFWDTDSTMQTVLQGWFL